MIDVDSKTVGLFKKIAKILSPPPVLKVSEWADRYRRLSQEASSEPGRWNTDRAPYQRAILDAVCDPECEDIVVMSSAQVGKTEILLNIIGYFIDYDPSPILCVQPTLEMAQTFSKDRLAPMVRDSPSLRGKVRDVKSKDSGNTILHKKFPGGHITMVGANSAQGLAGRPIKVVLMDEIDRYPLSSGTEGNPIKLAEKRTTTFWNRKKIKVSTPTIKGVSLIEAEFDTSSGEIWNVPCPACGKLQPYEFSRIDHESVTMECMHCGKRFKELEWKANAGCFVALRPEIKKKRGFRLNELASPWSSWDSIIAAFKEATNEMKLRGSIESLKVWVNTSMGETWEERGQSADEGDLLLRRQLYNADIPDGVLLLTAGVDVHEDRFEVEVVGWGHGYESYGIYYTVIKGNTEQDDVWNELEDFLGKEFLFENGNPLLIACSCIDTGGHRTTECYKWLKKMQRKNKLIFGIKGVGGSDKPLVYGVSNNNIEKVDILLLGVDSGKEILMTRLKLDEAGPGYCHFPNNADRGYDELYFKGLTSEQRVIRFKDSRPYLKWVKKSGARNEPLDTRNYATAAAEYLRPDFDVLQQKIDLGINYMKRPTQNKKRSSVISSGVEV